MSNAVVNSLAHVPRRTLRMIARRWYGPKPWAKPKKRMFVLFLYEHVLGPITTKRFYSSVYDRDLDDLVSMVGHDLRLHYPDLVASVQGGRP